MSDVPKQLQYTKEHEWIRREDDGTVVVGITAHAQHQLGELDRRHHAQAHEHDEAHVPPARHVDAESLALVGGKGANLGELRRAGLPVPPPLCITPRAYRRQRRRSSRAAAASRPAGA